MVLKHKLSLLMLVLLFGCRQEDRSPQIAELERKVNVTTASMEALLKQLSEYEKAQEARLAALEKQIGSLAEGHNAVQKDISALRTQVSAKSTREEVAELDPSIKEYAIARNEYGLFPILVENAEPFLDGHKVTLRIGNLTGATMTGVELRIAYGPRRPALPNIPMGTVAAKASEAWVDYFGKLEEAKKKMRTITVQAGKVLAPSSWTLVAVTLSPSKPEDLGRLEVGVENSGVSLSQPR